MTSSLSQSSGGTVEQDGPLGIADAVPLPEIDIPFEIVFRNLFKQQQTKQNLNKHLEAASRHSRTDTATGLAPPAYCNGGGQTSQNSATRRQLMSKLTIGSSGETRGERSRGAKGEHESPDSTLLRDLRGQTGGGGLCGSILSPEPSDQICMTVRNHKERPLVLRLINALTKHFQQSRKTKHLSIAYADYLLTFEDIFDCHFKDQNYFHSKFPILDGSARKSTLARLRLEAPMLAFVCVLMASKFCEVDDNLIAIQDMQQFLKTSSQLDRHYRVSYDEMTRSEIFALERLQWDLHRIVPLDFGEVYHEILKRQVNQASFSNHQQTLEKIWAEVEQAFDQLMLRHDVFLQYRQSDVAFAVVRMSLNKAVESDESLARLVQTDRFYARIFNLIATNDKIKIYSHEAQKHSAVLSKSLEEITQKLMTHVFCEAESHDQTNGLSDPRNQQQTSSGLMKGLISPKNGLVLASQGSGAADQENYRSGKQKTSKKSESDHSSVEQQSLIEDEVNDPKFKGNHSEQKQIITLTGAVNSFKRSIAATAQPETEGLCKRMGIRQPASRQAGKRTDSRQTSQQPASSHKKSSLQPSSVLQAATSHFAKFSREVKQHLKTIDKKMQPRSAMDESSEVKDISPLVCSKDDEQAQEAKKHNATTKYVELDENFQEVQGNNNNKEEKDGEDQMRFQSPSEIEEEGFELKPQYKRGGDEAGWNQGLNSLMASSLYRRESKGSFEAGQQKSQHYLSKRLQSKITEINQRRRQLGSNGASESQRDDSVPGSGLSHIGPRLRSGVSSYSRLNGQSCEPKPTPEYQIPIIAPDPDLARQRQPSTAQGSKTATAKASPAAAKIFEEQEHHRPDSGGQFYTFAKEHKPKSSGNGAKLLKMSGSGRLPRNAHGNAIQKQLTASGHKEAGSTFKGRLNSPPVVESGAMGPPCFKNVFGNSLSPPTYFATVKSQGSGQGRAVDLRKEGALSQARCGERGGDKKRPAGPGALEKPLAPQSSLGAALVEAQANSGGKNAEATGDFPRVNQQRSRASHGWANAVLCSAELARGDVDGPLSQRKDGEVASNYNKRGSASGSRGQRMGSLQHKNSNMSNFQARGASTRQNSLNLIAHSKGKVARQTNTACSNKPDSPQRSRSRRSVNGSDCREKQIQHAAAAVLARSKRQSAKDLNHYQQYRANGPHDLRSRGKLSPTDDTRLAAVSKCIRHVSTQHTQRKSAHNQLLFKHTERALKQTANESRSNSEYSRTYLKSNLSYQKMGSAEMMHSQENLRCRGNNDGWKRTKARGTVLGIRNQNQTERLGANGQSSGRGSQRNLSKQINKNSQEQQSQKKHLTGNRSSKQMSTLPSTKQLSKSRSNYFEKRAPGQSRHDSRGRHLKSSLKLFTNISQGQIPDLSHGPKMTAKESEKNSNEKSTSLLKGKSSPGNQQHHGKNAGSKDLTHNRILFSPEEKSPPATLVVAQEKRTSISVFKPKEARTRVRNKGSFSLCMSNVNQKIRLKDEDHSKQPSLVNPNTRNHTGICSSMGKQSMTQQQARCSIKSSQDDISMLQTSQCFKEPRRTAEVGPSLDNNRKSQNKKDHYLRILRAHNKQQSQKQVIASNKSLLSNNQLSTSSTTPAGVHATHKAVISRGTRPGVQAAKHGEPMLRKTASKRGISQMKSPKTAAQISSAQQRKAEEDDEVILEEQQPNKFGKSNAPWSEQKSFDLDPEKYRTQQTAKWSAKNTSKDIHTDRKDSFSDSEHGCDKPYSITQIGESGRSRMETRSVGGSGITKTLDSFSYRNEALSKETSPLRKSRAPALQAQGLKIKACPSSNKQEVSLISATQRSSMITPKQSTQVRAKRIESTDSYQMYPSQRSTKNLNPRAVKNRYQPSTKRQELANQRQLATSSVLKEDPLSQDEEGRTKKAVVFSPSLKHGARVHQYTNPFKMGDRYSLSKKRDAFKGASTSIGQIKKTTKGVENFRPTTKMMSFVERRQINLNSNRQSMEKTSQDKRIRCADDQDNGSSIDREVKPSIRKFNLDSIDKKEQAAESVFQEAPSTPRDTQQAQESKTDTKGGEARKSNMKAMKAKNIIQSTTVYLTDSVQVSKKAATSTLRNSKNDLRSILKLQLDGQGGSMTESGARTDDPDEKAEQREAQEDNAAPSVSVGARPLDSGRAQRSQRGQKSTINKKNQIGSNTQLPRQIHVLGASTVVASGKRAGKPTHQLLENKRSKNNYSEMRVKTSHFEINLESLKSNAMDSAEISKLDETQKTARTIRQLSSFTRSPLQSGQSCLNPSTSDSITMLPSKKKNANVGSQPSVILEASDQCENEKATTPGRSDNGRALHDETGGVNQTCIQLQSQEYTCKPLKSTIVLNDQSDATTTCGRLDKAGAWQSQSCIQPSELSMSHKNTALGKLHQHLHNQYSIGNKQKGSNVKKQRRTAQERKTFKRMPVEQ